MVSTPVDPRREAALKYDAETPPGCQAEPHDGTAENDEGCRVCAYLAGQLHGEARRQADIQLWCARWFRQNRTAEDSVFIEELLAALAAPDHDWRKS